MKTISKTDLMATMDLLHNVLIEDKNCGFVIFSTNPEEGVTYSCKTGGMSDRQWLELVGQMECFLQELKREVQDSVNANGGYADE